MKRKPFWPTVFSAALLISLTPAAMGQNGPPSGNPPGQGGLPPGQGGTPPGQGVPSSATVQVDCDAGESIGAAIATRALELTIEFTGTCTEDVEIDRDRSTLRGDAAGTIDGSLTVRGASNVVLEDFTVANGRGVRITDGSSADVTRVTSRDSSLGLGFRVEMSSNARLADVMAINNTFAGIAAINNSHIRLLGSVVVSQSSDVGIFAAGSSEIDSRATSLVSDDNAYAGVFVQTGASVFLSTLSVANNFLGLGLVDGAVAAINGGTLAQNIYGVDIDTGSSAEISDLTVDGGGVAVLGNSSLRARNLAVTGPSHPDFATGIAVRASHLLISGGSLADSLYLAEGGQANFSFPLVTIGGAGLLCEPSAIAYGGLSCPP